MSQTIDQILLRLGIDQSQVFTGLNDFKKKVEDATGHAHKSFVHAGTGAKEFHKVLHQITEESPILGTALKAVFSPIGAVLGGATLAFTYLNKQLEEFNKHLDEMTEKAVKPMVNYHEAAKKAAEEVNKAVEAEKKWEAEFKSRHSAAKDGLEREIDLLKIRSAWVDKAIDQEKARHRAMRNAGLDAAVRSGSMLPETAAELKRQGDAKDDFLADRAKLQARLDAMSPAMRIATGARMAAGRELEDALGGQDSMKAASMDRAKQLIETLEESRKQKEEELNKAKVAGAAEEPHGQGKFVASGVGVVYIPPEMTKGDIKDSDKKINALSKELETLTHNVEKAQKAYKELENAHEDDNDAVIEARNKLSELTDKEHDLKRQRDELKTQLSQPFMAPGAMSFTPSYAQPQFSDYLNTKGPYQRIAQRLQANEQAALYWNVQGRKDIAQRFIEANEGRDVQTFTVGGVPVDASAGAAWGSRAKMTMSHIPGLRDQLPKIAAGESEKDYLRAMQKDIEALRMSGVGTSPAEGLKVIPAAVQ